MALRFAMWALDEEVRSLTPGRTKLRTFLNWYLLVWIVTPAELRSSSTQSTYRDFPSLRPSDWCDYLGCATKSRQLKANMILVLCNTYLLQSTKNNLT